jgi:hypothetical protein
MPLSRHLWHQRQRRRLDRHDGFALLFEHVPARIDARHAFVVLVQKRLNEVALGEGCGPLLN